MEPPEDFPFPFPAYGIQKNFMKELYSCLDNGKLGIFESPTGTGKSLSIICGALKWLADRQERDKSELIARIDELDKSIKAAEASTDDWFFVQTKQMHLHAERQALQSKLDIVLKYEEKKRERKEKVKQHKIKKECPKKFQKIPMQKQKERAKNEEKQEAEKSFAEDFIIEDVFTESKSSDEEDIAEDIHQNIKIFFCSRTHSQLSQFVGELKRSPYSEIMSTAVIASRQNYCINKTVKNLKHVNLINERCLQIQRHKPTVKKEKEVKRSKTGSGCPFMPGNQEFMMAKILTEIQDIEEVIQNGQELGTCPYYASRNSVKDGQLILVPYNSILHKNTRSSSGINLKGNVVIIDEAHNLLDAIEQMYSSTVTGRQLLHCYSQLSQYQKRFQTLFSAKSILCLGQLSFCLKKLIAALGATTRSDPKDEVTGDKSPMLYKLEEFEVATNIDTINMFELLEFVRKSKLIHKLQGFVDQCGSKLTIHNNNMKNQSGVSQFLKTIATKEVECTENTQQQANTDSDDFMSNPLMAIVSFLECLKNNCADGRILVIPGAIVGQGVIKFLLLNPASHFHDIVRDARAVVVAGGTMQPMSEFTEQLFLNAGAPLERIITFSCDHVIPPENLIANIATSGPTGIEFEFNFQTRQNVKLLDELGRALLNLCNVVPAGIVVFLPSYNYEDIVYKHLQKTGLFEKMRRKKCIFREPKSTAQVNHVLDEYGKFIKNPQPPQNGSLLFSVVGGKLSEGLNFSDDLGRCVVVVGMPYPNIKSAELQEKMKYLNENVKPGTGNIFYENSCMKAVNQCIGRAVRHINDYSTVVLLDKRYCHKTKALPRWIQRTLTIHDSFGSMIGNTAKFFAQRRRKNTEANV